MDLIPIEIISNIIVHYMHVKDISAFTHMSTKYHEIQQQAYIDVLKGRFNVTVNDNHYLTYISIEKIASLAVVTDDYIRHLARCLRSVGYDTMLRYNWFIPDAVLYFAEMEFILQQQKLSTGTKYSDYQIEYSILNECAVDDNESSQLSLFFCTVDVCRSSYVADRISSTPASFIGQRELRIRLQQQYTKFLAAYCK